MSDTRAGQAAGRAADSLQDAGARAAQQARETAGVARDQAASLTREAQDRGTALAGEVRDQVLARAEGGREQAAERLDEVAGAVRQSAERLEGEQPWLAGLVESGADELSAFAATLRGNDLRGVLGQAEGLARRQPALFLGASMAAGFALARLGRVAASGGAARATATDGATPAAAAGAGRRSATPAAPHMAPDMLASRADE